jgi:hypothetical protein
MRTLLWLSLLCFNQLPMPCEAQTAAKDREDIRALDQKLSAMEKALADLKAAVAATAQKLDRQVSNLEQAATSQGKSAVSDEQRNYLNKVDTLKEKFEAMQDKMVQTAGSLAATEVNIAYHYFTIFGVMVALAGVVGTLAALLIKRIVSDGVSKNVEAQIGKSILEEEKEMKRIARFETDLAMAETLFKMSFAWWEQYEEPFRNLLQKRTTRTDHQVFDELPENASLQLTMARILSERGIKIAGVGSFSGSNKDDNRPWLIRARLLNLWVYNATADLCRKNNASENERNEVLKSAEHLIEFAKDKRTATAGLWYNFQQTAAFAMMNLGHQGTQGIGEQLILDLCAKKTPGDGFEPPPNKWIDDLRTENAMWLKQEGAPTHAPNQGPPKPASDVVL